MNCPVCGFAVRTYDTRNWRDELLDYQYVKRKRECLEPECRHRFSSIEIEEDVFLAICAKEESTHDES